MAEKIQRKGLRGYLSRTFNVYEWMGADILWQGAKSIKGLYGDIISPPSSGIKETFSQAVVRMGLTEYDIAKQARYYKFTSSIYGIFFIFAVLYALILFLSKNVGAGCMGTAYAVLMFAFYFRESFWLMQIKRRRLGHNFIDWVAYLVKGK